MKVRGKITVDHCSPRTAAKIGTVWGIEPEIVHHADQYIWFVMFDDKDAIGIASSFPLHPYKNVGMVLEHWRWHPKASPRRKVEAAYQMAMDLASQLQWVGYSRKHDFKFFKTLQRHGVLRKVGTQSAGFGELVTVWETPRALLKADEED